MSNAEKTDYMEHPLVHAYLRDLDCALQGVASDEATMIRQSVNEHLVSEFAADKSGGTPETVIRKALDKLGPVEAITAGLTGKDTGAVEPVMGKSRILFISALSAVSALLVPFGAGFSMLLSVLAIVLTVKLSSSRARGILLTVNAAVLAIALVYLILAFTTAGALMETVHSSGGF
ncbi:hypothetical protein [Mobiluncus mulieris]|uniref:hypothetical protein n=1 Tax=Mobiluncus mulieris TaxID=2052 RepID=UPI0021E1BFB8|nr:hypothetical protein [Mobiluncus mulieris]MCU9995811.1 hypothetical protein [Mobiluncus mulieris]MCV0009135.1 hypothetical protein [Mobiluncus mulieris]